MPYRDREDQRRWQRENNARLRAEWIAANGPCVTCGGTEDLEVDHVDPALKVDHKVWTWSAERRTVELAKCQVLCKKCHREKTTEQSSQKAVHGSIQMYERGCRCQECRAHKSAYQKQWRAVHGRTDVA